MAEYGFDLVAEYDTVGARRLWILIQGLPPDAALYREDAWSREEEMLASLLELTDAWGHAMVVVHGGKMKGHSKPLHVRRPWESEEQTKTVIKLSDTAQLAALFGKMN